MNFSDIFKLYGLEKLGKLEGQDFKIYWKVIEFINWQVKKYVGKWTLKNGDDFFNNYDLSILLKTMFWYGKVGISKYNDKLVSLIIYDLETDAFNEFEKGKGIVANGFVNNFNSFRNKQINKYLDLNNKNCELLNTNNLMFSPFLEVWQLANTYSLAWNVYEKNLMLSQKMLVIENVNASEESGIKNRFRKFFTTISTNNNSSNYGLGTDFSSLGTSSGNDLKNSLMNSKLGTLKMGTEDLGNIKNAIDNTKSEADEVMGNRTNINFKKERQITGEIDYLDFYFDSIENTLKVNFNKSIEKINKMFNKNYEIILINEVKATNDDVNHERVEEVKKDDDLEEGEENG